MYGVELEIVIFQLLDVALSTIKEFVYTLLDTDCSVPLVDFVFVALVAPITKLVDPRLKIFELYPKHEAVAVISIEEGVWYFGETIYLLFNFVTL